MTLTLKHLCGLWLKEKDSYLHCRYYEKKLPDVDDLVMVRVKNVTDYAATVSLTEYNNIDRMVPFTELARRRMRTIPKHIKVGSNVVLCIYTFVYMVQNQT